MHPLMQIGLSILSLIMIFACAKVFEIVTILKEIRDKK